MSGTLTHVRDIPAGSLIPLFGGIVEVHLVGDPPSGFPAAVALWVVPVGQTAETMVLLPADWQGIVIPEGNAR